MFKKYLAIILALGVVAAGLIGYSVVRVSSGADSFNESGYIHVDPLESIDKRFLFDANTNFKTGINDTVSFKDVQGEKKTVDANNYIHYDSSSLSSFRDGVLVDLDDLDVDSTTTKHYSLSSKVKLEYAGGSYSTSNANQDLSFQNFIWKLDENKYMIVSPSMSIAMSVDDVRDATGYLEVTYLGDNLIQLQTKDNVWQTISKECRVRIDDGNIVDLSYRNIQDSEGVIMMDFSRLVVDSDDNLEISPKTESMQNVSETVIPHFDITANPGLDGVSGAAGESGEPGDPGEAGTNGTPGTSGTNGAQGAVGNRGQQGIKGGSDATDGEILNFPVFTIKDWKVTASGCQGVITIKDEAGMLTPDETEDVYAMFYVEDLETGERIFVGGGDGSMGSYNFANIDVSGYAFNVTGLKNDHSYLLYAVAPTQIDASSDPYNRIYISKTFWTDSLGIYMEPAGSTVNSISFDTIKSNSPENVGVYYYVFDNIYDATNTNLASIKDPTNHMAWEQIQFGGFTDKITIQQGLLSNTNYYVRMAFDINGDNPKTTAVFDDLSSQILEIRTLKKTASVSSPILTVNRNIWGFDITPGIVNDPDGGIVTYTYEFYDTNDLENDGTTIKTGALPKKTITVDSARPVSVTLDEIELMSGAGYAVRVIAKFDDNEKTYTIASPLSNDVTIEGSSRPVVYFKGYGETDDDVMMGSYVTVPYYDSAKGEIHINPGSEGAKLLLRDSAHTNGVNPPTITIRLNGYYSITYPVYLESDSEALSGQKWLKGEIMPSGEVVVYVLDYLDNIGSSSNQAHINGLQPGKSYEIIVRGDVSEDGTTVIEANRNVEIGRCVIKTQPMTPTTLAWTNDKNALDALQNVTVKMYANGAETDPVIYKRYERQKKTIKTVQFDLYAGDYTEEQILTQKPRAIGTITWDAIDDDGNVNDAVQEKINKLFTDEGVTFTSADFGKVSSELARNAVLTLRVSGVYDYTDAASNRLAQSEYSAFADTDKNYVASGGNYYRNEFELINPVNTIVSVKGLDPIYVGEKNTAGNQVGTFSKLAAVDENSDGKADGYRMLANYSNLNQTAARVTYYVFDAPDFFGFTSTTAKALPAGDTSGCQYSYTDGAGHTKTYHLNTEFKEWLTDGVAYGDGDKRSWVIPYVDAADGSNNITGLITPVHFDELPLTKITLDVPSIGGIGKIPTVIFYPMTKEEYCTQKGISIASLGQTNGSGEYYLFYDDLNFDGTYHTQAEKLAGHQFVFAWTVDCHTENLNAHYIYPFDAELRYSVAGVDHSVPYDSKDPDASTLIRSANSSLSGIPNCVYVKDNADAKYGYQGYMFIPHSTFWEFPEADVPKQNPQGYALQWTSGTNSVTMRTMIYDVDNAVNKYASTNTAEVYVYRGESANKYQKLTGSQNKVLVENRKISEISGYSNIGTYMASYLTRSDATSTPSTDSTLVTISAGQIPLTLKRTDGNSTISDAIAAVPIQLYLDKYTKKCSSLHSTGNDYIVSSPDGNWTFKNCCTDEKSVNKFAELFTTQIKETVSVASRCSSEMTIEFEQAKGGGKVTYYYVRLKGPKELFTDALGVRLTFKGKMTTDNITPAEFTIDKYLRSSIDMYTLENGRDVTVTEIDSLGIMTLRFKLSVVDELAKNYFENGNPFSYDLSGQEDVEVKAQMIYENNSNAGYKELVEAQRTAYNITKTYALRTFTKNLAAEYEDGLLQTNMPAYLEFINATTLRSTAIDRSDLPNFGSFMSMYLQSAVGNGIASLNVRSTRFWQFGTGYNTTQQISLLTSNNQQSYVPVNVVLSGNIPVYEKLDGVSDPVLTTTIDLPTAEPKIQYGASTESFDNMTLNYTFSAPDDKMYFTVSKKRPDTTKGNEADYYQLTNCDSDDEFIYDNIEFFNDDQHAGKYYHPHDPSNLQFEEDSKVWLDADESITYEEALANPDPGYDNVRVLAPYLFEVDKASDFMGLYDLASKTEYVIVCWRWTLLDRINLGGVTGVTKDVYGFRRIEMTASAGDVANYFAKTTADLPTAKITNIKYESLSDDEKTLTFKTEMSNYRTDRYYYTLSLCDNEGGNFITYLYAGSGSMGDKMYDCDGVDFTIDPSELANRKIYQYDIDEIVNAPLMVGDYGVKLAEDPSRAEYYLEYGKSYRVKMHVYKLQYGPAFETGYDFTADSAHILGNVPEASFVVENKGDFVAAFGSTLQVLADEPSYYSYLFPGVTRNAGALKTSYAVPVLIYQMTDDGGNTHLYDLTSRLYIKDADGAKTYLLDDPNPDKYGMVTMGGNTAYLDITYLDTDGKYKDIYKAESKMYMYVYAYQGGQIVGGDPEGDDHYNDNIKLEGSVRATDTAISAELIMNTRAYSHPAGGHEADLADLEISVEDWNKLKPENGYATRMLTSNERIVQPVKITAGTVTVYGIQSNRFLSVGMSNIAGGSSIKGVVFGIKLNWSAQSDGGSTITGELPLTTFSQKLTSADVGNRTETSLLLDIGTYLSGLPAGATITNYTVQLYFTTTDPTVVIPVQFDANPYTPNPDEKRAEISDKGNSTATIANDVYTITIVNDTGGSSGLLDLLRNLFKGKSGSDMKFDEDNASILTPQTLSGQDEKENEKEPVQQPDVQSEPADDAKAEMQSGEAISEGEDAAEVIETDDDAEAASPQAIEQDETVEPAEDAEESEAPQPASEESDEEDSAGEASQDVPEEHETEEAPKEPLPLLTLIKNFFKNILS